MFGACEGHFEVVRFLVEKEANMEAQDILGRILSVIVSKDSLMECDGGMRFFLRFRPE